MNKPTGLLYSDNILSSEEESALVLKLEALPFYPVKMHGVESKRSVIHYGWMYEYSKASIAPTAPLPAFLEFLRERAAEFSKVDPQSLAQVLIARYPRGAGIGWHRDAAVFGEPVVGISLYSPCVLRFRREAKNGFETYAHLLNQRSIYAISGEARSVWQHGITSTKSLRYSITFRVLKPTSIY